MHKGNTAKLVTHGVIATTVDAMQRFPENADVQKAAAMAVASLARTESTREALGEAGVCDLVMRAAVRHVAQARVVSKIALAIECLAQVILGIRNEFIASVVDCV